MSYEPLHHKYRPQTFTDLVGQEAIATTLTNAILTKKIAPAYLFTGSRGTGKTSSARILAKSLNCLKSNKPTAQPCGVCDVCHGIAKGSALDVIEIDAASNTGVDNIREIIERAQFAPVQCRYKVYVIDECHMLSVAAFNALLKTLEEPPEHVVFVLATTDPQRVLPTIISRCQRFDFRRIRIEAMVAHLQAIAAKENINITPAAVHLVASFAQGGLRDAESLLDQLSLLSGQVTIERVWDLVGSVAEPDLLELLQAIAQHHPEALLDRVRRIMDRGKEPLTLLQNLAGFYRDLLIAKTAPHRSDLVTVTPLTWEALCEQAKTWDVDRILSGQQHLAKSEVQIKNTTQPRLWLEVRLLGLLSPASSDRSSISPAQPSHQLQNADGLLKHQSQPQSKINSDNIAQTQPATPTQTTSTPENSLLPAKSENLPPIQQVEQDSAPAPVPAKTEAEVESVLPVSEPATLASATPEVSTEEVWQQILSNLQPKSTRELLRQMGQLIEFDGNIARIGMRTQALCNQAKAYLPKIKAAFQATFQQAVEVKLELATATSAKSTAVKESPVTSKASIPVTSPPTNQQVTSYITATASSQASTTQRQPETKAGDLTASQISTPPITEVVSNAATAADWDDNEVAIASQRLADFFKGDLVGIKDDSFIQPTAAPNLSSSANSDWYDADAAGETEIDF
jgi:DNA polymerase-3 subunit gamma/tau